MKTIMMLVVAMQIGCGGDDSFTAQETEPVVKEEPTCKANVTGQLTLANGASSVQTAQLNGVDYGKINTGSSITLTLPPGGYSVQYNHTDGSPACMPAQVTVSVCSTQHLTCEG